MKEFNITVKLVLPYFFLIHCISHYQEESKELSSWQKWNHHTVQPGATDINGRGGERLYKAMTSTDNEDVLVTANLILSIRAVNVRLLSMK